MDSGAVSDEFGDDLVLLVQACAAAFGDRVLAHVRSEAGDSVRFSDGYVFQHLVHGPLSVTELASQLGVSQQAASKQAADLELRGLVERRMDPNDGRAKLVDLSDLGWRAVEAGRVARGDVQADITAMLGPGVAVSMMKSLRRISDHVGALEQMGHRRLRPESER